MIARFGGQAEYELPRDFFDDFVTVRLQQRCTCAGQQVEARAACWPFMINLAALPNT